MPLAARCHSLRPDRGSGWLAFFELAPRGERSAHFLVVGPADASRGAARAAALRAGQVAVRYLKDVPEAAPHLTLLESIARIVAQEVQTSGEEIEFGAGVLVANQVWFVTRGSVRLAPLAPIWSPALAAERAVVFAVAPGSRLFFGRLADGGDERSTRDFISRLESSGGGDGGLIVSFIEGSPLRALPGRPGMDTRARRSAADIPPPRPEEPLRFEEIPPGPEPQAELPAPQEPPPPEPATFDSMLSELRETFREDGDPSLRVEPPAEQVDVEPPYEEAAFASPEAGPVEPAAEEAGDDILPLDREPAPYAPEERRGLGFWLGLVAAILCLLAVIAYLGILRPRLRQEAPATDAPPEQAAAQVDTPVPTTQAGQSIEETAPAILWEEELAQPVTSSPLLVGDRVVFGCRDGRVYALDRASGRRVWAYAAGEGFGSSPALAESLIVIGGYDGNIYGLSALTGEERWTVATGGRIVASPAVDSTLAFVGSYDRSFYAVHLADGRVMWKRDLGTVLWSSPVLGGDLVITAGLDGRVTAMDRRNGQVRWQATCGGSVYGTPVVAERKVVVGCQDGNLYAFDLADGRAAWTVACEGPVNGSPAYREGRVLVGTDEGRILGVDLGLGRIVWRVATGGDVKSRPAFLDRIAWVSGYDGHLHGIEWLTGAEVARIPLDSAAYSSPAVQDGTAYIGVMDGRFLALRLGLKTS